jgi:hypothetical protein
MLGKSLWAEAKNDTAGPGPPDEGARVKGIVARLTFIADCVSW